MRRSKNFYKMMSEIKEFIKTEMEMNRRTKSLIDVANLLLHRYQCGCFLRQNYKTKACLFILNVLYDNEKILSEIRAVSIFIHFSGEKNHWDLKKDLSKVGIELIACC